MRVIERNTTEAVQALYHRLELWPVLEHDDGVCELIVEPGTVPNLYTVYGVGHDGLSTVITDFKADHYDLAVLWSEIRSGELGVPFENHCIV